MTKTNFSNIFFTINSLLKANYKKKKKNSGKQSEIIKICMFKVQTNLKG